MKEEKSKIKPYAHIENLASALQECGYEIEIDWDAEWYCIDNKVHHGIELIITNTSDGDGNCYSFIFNKKGQRITYCTEGEE